MRNGFDMGILVASLALLATACSDDGGEAPADPAVARGKAIYVRVCVACHAGDPTQDGSLGPALAGASRELLEAKVLRNEYPPGYEPRRPTTTMPKFEYLAEGIDDLAAYLATQGVATQGAAGG